MLCAGLRNLAQVVDGERRSGMRPHVQLLYAEVDGVGSCLQRGYQRFARPDGCHNLKILDCFVHGCKVTKNLSKREANKIFCLIEREDFIQ